MTTPSKLWKDIRHAMKLIPADCRANARGMLRNTGLFRGQSPIGRIYVLDGDYWLVGENNEVRQLHDATLAQTIERLLDARRVPV